MHTEHFKSVKIHHAVADINIDPHIEIDSRMLKRLIRLALNNYSENVSAAVVHQEAKERHGENYQTVGYYLKLYRTRRGFTQEKLATLAGIKQHHLSEMENNKRPLGKKLAKQLADILGIGYHKLL